EGSQLTYIGEWAFSGSGITSIILPAGVITIGDFAFRNAASLQVITMLGNYPPSISSNTFAGVDKFNVELMVPQQAMPYFVNALFWRYFFSWTRIVDCGLGGSGHWSFYIGDARSIKMVIDCSCYECCHYTGIFIIELEIGMDIELNFCYYDVCWRFVRIQYCGNVLEISFWITDGLYFRAYVWG
ncbi:MAG: leucine-rich repeat domain-containing protein, partial [Firmicutes bacterium]|nr:leucine-rich repeat domain-containing protein [Bacillota bacterium]